MEINFEGALSKEDYIKINQLHNPYKKLGPLLIIMIPLMIFVIVYQYLAKKEISYVFIGLTLFWVYIILFRRYKMKKIWNAAKEIKEHCSGIVNDQGIVINSKTWSSNKTWDYFTRYKEAPEMVLLYQSYAIIHALPRSYFKNDSDWISFVEIVQNNVASK